MNNEDTEDPSRKQEKALLNQPWFKEAYKAAVKFYEKDDVLDSKDRGDLYEAYNSISRAQMFGGWLGFSSVFIPPFACQYYKTKGIRGVKVQRNFIIGLLTLAGSSLIATNIAYKRKLEELDPNQQFGNKGDYGDDLLEASQGNFPQQVKPRQQRQYEMMDLLGSGSATRWAAYFSITEKHPEKRLPNPTIKLQEIQQEGLKRSSYLNQRDPIGLHDDIPEKKPVLTDLLNEKKETAINPSNSNVDTWAGIRTGNSVGSSWDKIRNNSPIGTNDDSTADSMDIFGFDKNLEEPNSDIKVKTQPIVNQAVSQEEFDKLLERERNNN
ncbi:similar to Saccharomyces cerevisiae YIL077C Putative protein of unknown function [Maudiozyma barnettii]|uniref:Uncharacterized protein n=1 Tax=Maudiozyma barnettii TaxID=61262 RepID=A0A8H2ZFY1_9SACH|nr:Rci37p [Kazachstania barnettii]CAB4252230.1 similar to Saccharomyces cerevisiae YIL077C Putative protein of unknown function [Kazachstania barnettii]CAD1778879.1 similar to Saccharomyces cerevisiae YIL077C Putative protein of unknown function [Kazachstania barnettii]